MLSSKDLLERTGISRATLNNYIAAGLVVRPDVLPPGPEDGGAPRIGYFPDDTVERLETIQRLKREGWSLGRIVEYFAQGHPHEPATVQPPPAVAPSLPRSSAALPAAPAPPDARDPEQTPQLAAVAALAVVPHDAEGLWVRLSVHDYFELSAEVESELRRLVNARRGQALRLAPYRFMCHFIPRPPGDALVAAIEVAGSLKTAIAEINVRWKLRRNWGVDILMNTALAVGEAWISPDAKGDFQVVGDVTAEAQHIAACGDAGALLASRDFIARLPPTVRDRVVYGVRTGNEPARHQLMTFTRLKTLASTMRSVPRRIADMPVAEVIELRVSPYEKDYK